MKFHEPTTLERMRDDGDGVRIMARESAEAQEGEEEVLVRVCGLVFDCETIGGNGEVEEVVRKGAVLRWAQYDITY